MVSRTTTLFHEVIFVVIHVRFITWREPSCKNGLSKYRCCVGATTVAINELLCLKNSGAQISLFFTSSKYYRSLLVLLEGQLDFKGS